MVVDWTQIIISLSTLLLGGGGLVTIVTLKDKKMSAMLDNISLMVKSNSATNDEWQEIASERAQRTVELKNDLDRKEGVIREQYREIADLRTELDNCRTALAVEELLKCEIMACEERRPPFGTGKCKCGTGIVKNNI